MSDRKREQAKAALGRLAAKDDDLATLGSQSDDAQGTAAPMAAEAAPDAGAGHAVAAHSSAADASAEWSPAAANLDDTSATIGPEQGFSAQREVGMQSRIHLSDNDDLIVVNTPSGGTGMHDKYEIGSVIARGGMGAIMATRDQRLRRPVAMKVLLNQRHATPEQISRLVHEAQVTGQLEHPNIVPVHELGSDDTGRPFYTMKLIKGTTLKTILEGLRKGDPEFVYGYSLNKLLTIYLRCCDAVAFAHSKYVIHRDLKPENIMVGDFGEVLVLDWGLAKVLKVARHGPDGETIGDDASWEHQSIHSARMDDEDVVHTMMGQTVGTPAFMAPEQANGQLDRLSDRTDIYSLGAILYNILALRPPVTGNSVVEILGKVTSGEIEDPTVHSNSSSGDAKDPAKAAQLIHCPGKRIPTSLAAVAMKALSYEPDDRYQTVLELQSDIEAYLNGFATNAEDASWWRHTVLSLRRHRGATTVAVVATVLITALLVGFVWSLNEQRNEARESARQATENFEKLFDANRARLEISRQVAPEFLDRAQRMVLDGKLSEAYDAVNKCISMDPNLPDAILLRGLLLIAEGHYSAANADFSRLTQIYADSPSAVVIALERSTSLAADTPAAFPFRLDADGLVAMHQATRGASYAAIHAAIFPDLGVEAADAEVRQLWYDKTAAAIPGILKAANPTDTTLECTSIASTGEVPGLIVTINSRFRLELSPLQRLPIIELHLHAPVLDLTFLRDLPLETVDVAGTTINSVTVFASMPRLRSLNLADCEHLRDVSGLTRCKALETLILPEQIRQFPQYKELPTLKKIGHAPDALWAPADFGKGGPPLP